MHTKVSDEAAHTGDLLYKKDQISSLDRDLKLLVQGISPMIHFGEPVPVLMAGPSVRRDDVEHFSEIHVERGCLGMLRCAELMLMILNFSNRGILYGHQLGPINRDYLPTAYDPFELF